LAALGGGLGEEGGYVDWGAGGVNVVGLVVGWCFSAAARRGHVDTRGWAGALRWSTEGASGSYVCHGARSAL